jgi:Xaa-Pro dipeptidase
VGQTVDSARLRSHCLSRTREQLRAQGAAAALLFDSANIRYTTAPAAWSVYNLHNSDRWALVPVDSEPVLWESGAFLHDGYGWDGDVRPAPEWRPYGSGPLTLERARRFAGEVMAEIASRGLAGERIGLDKLDAAGYMALLDAGARLEPVQLAMERARSVKCPDEIELMRVSTDVCRKAMASLREALKPGVTEQQLLATFNGTGLALGCEFHEGRAVVAGSRTNPWLQESSEKVVEDGELVGIDSNQVGPGGYLTDISRTYLCGEKAATDQQRRLYTVAYEFIHGALPSFRPGVAFEDLGRELAPRMPKQYWAHRYPSIAHGVGLAHEYPAVLWEDHHAGEIEAGMVLSVEAYVGEDGGSEGVKLEEEILVTVDGFEVLADVPYDERLLT